MEYSHHSRLYGSRSKIPAIKDQGLLRAIMLPFEVLNRQNWSAPWDIERARAGTTHRAW